ncbi:MAG TPA: exosortase F system-associated protein [Flavobacterium sp.]|uniref:exosortase F system-associated membrane protein n=1 Tax=Flavobacterium sp. TaxID=239 RepID=UPI002C92CEE0|nr:exosortase F system-associated protein [Flavobacterium sp.]HSD14674.1 exosortase F system-associated protein [Flavobacterium sp.]
MLKEVLRNKAKIVWIFVLVALLAMIRLFEQDLFYDPFLGFFKDEFQNASLPDYEPLPLFFGMTLRYFLNSVLSVLIIYVAFKDVQLVKVTSVLYLVFFVVLMSVFFGILQFSEKPDSMLLFYIRRFLIQPLFLVIFLPAFYYQRKNF